MSLTGSRVSPAEPRTGLAGTGAGLPAWLMWRAARGLLLCLLGSAVLFLLVQALPGDAASLAAGSGGPEAVARLTVVDFPAIVGIDCEGNNFYEIGQAPYRKL